MGEERGTHSSVKLVSSLRPYTCFCVSASPGLSERPADGLGALTLRRVKHVCMRARAVSGGSCAHTRTHTCILPRCVGEDHHQSRRVVHGHLSANVSTEAPQPEGTLGPSSCGLRCLMRARGVWDRNQLSKQGRPVWWGLNIRISHHGAAVRDRPSASGPRTSLSSVASVF